MNKSYIVYENYCTDIGWGKSYYKEGFIDNIGFGCSREEATRYTEKEAKLLILSLYDVSINDIELFDLYKRAYDTWGYELYEENI